MKTLMVVVACLVMVGCGYLDKPAAPKPEPDPKIAYQTAQFESVKAQAKAAEATQTRMLQLEIKVVEACVARGWVPTWESGNIYCRQAGGVAK